MRKKFYTQILVLAYSLFLLPLFMGSCIKTGTCHQAIKVVNNSENTISVRNLSMYQHDGVEYVVCVDKSYDSAQETAEYLTRKLGFPLVVNRVTRLRNNKYNIVRDNVCIEAYSKSLQNSSTDKYIIGDLDDDLYEIDFDLTTRNWSSQKDDDE